MPEAKDSRPAHLRRGGFDALPELSEVEVIRHFTRLSKWNYGVDDGILASLWPRWGVPEVRGA